MARGWESKNVEDQISGQEAAREQRAKPALSPAETARQTERNGLLLSRARTLASLQTACDGRYRALQERTLAHIDEQLARLDADAEADAAASAAGTTGAAGAAASAGSEADVDASRAKGGAKGTAS
jgi:hypothetical protein